MPWVFYHKKAAELADQAKPMFSCGIGSLAPLGDVRTNHVQCDDRPGGCQMRTKESIETPQCGPLLAISASGRPLVLEESLDFIGQR
jgi:hypothetical protein